MTNIKWDKVMELLRIPSSKSKSQTPKSPKSKQAGQEDTVSIDSPASSEKPAEANDKVTILQHLVETVKVGGQASSFLHVSLAAQIAPFASKAIELKSAVRVMTSSVSSAFLVMSPFGL